MKTKVAVLPIWKVDVEDNLYYYLLGTNKRTVLENLKHNSFYEDFINTPFVIKQISPDDASHILLQLDIENEDEITTLYEEAKYYSDHNCDFFLATNMDVIADATLEFHKSI
jgi:hypothetical protein